MLEKEIERKIGRLIKSKGGLWYKFVSPMNSGVPDRIAILPEGRVLFIEIKAKGGRLSPIQKVVHEEFSKRGVTVYTVKTVEEVEQLCE